MQLTPNEEFCTCDDRKVDAFLRKPDPIDNNREDDVELSDVKGMME